jgi:uncharacterized protein (TIGR02145 family)
LLGTAFFTAFMIIFAGCKKDAELPSLTTTAISTINATSVMTGGSVNSSGGSEITARGVCWSTMLNPTIADSKTMDGTGSGTFSSTMTGLTLNTKYYVRAYASNSSGTGYGDELMFTFHIPATLTASVESFATTYAVSGGHISDDGGGIITERGICWNTSGNPTTGDNKAINDIQSMEFTCLLRGLTPGTTYFIRAFAVNSAGTAYSDQLSFTTDVAVDPVVFNSALTYGTISDIEGNNYKTIQIGTRIWMAENLRTTKFNDGNDIPLVSGITEWSALSTPGYCWYNNDPVANKEIYGALYNWEAVTNGKLCPSGWHIPDKGDFNNLDEAAGLGYDPGGNLKESGTDHWSYYWLEATNSSGWTALPGGYRSVDGTFENLGLHGFWWLKDDVLAPDGEYAILMYDGSLLDYAATYDNYPDGLSVRCVQDN